MTPPDAAWEARLAALWAALEDRSEADFLASLDALVAELAPEHPVGLFEHAAGYDSTGHSDRAVPLYRAALSGGLSGIRRRRAVIQMASSLRNLGRPEESVALLQAEREQPSDELDDAVIGFLALALTDVGREREAASLALQALAPTLPRYQRSLGNYARTLTDPGITIREAAPQDWSSIWPFMKTIVRAGETFSWDRATTEEQARGYWMRKPPGHTFVAVDESGRILGTAEMGPNRGGGGAHIASGGFMVDPDRAGRGAGRALGERVIATARDDGYHGIQFNAVVATNTRAVSLWQSLGFEILATVPEGFEHPRDGLVGLHVMYRRL